MPRPARVAPGGLIYQNKLAVTLIFDEINQHARTDDPDGNACQRFFWSMQYANFNVLGIVNSTGILTKRYEYTPCA